MTDAVMTEVPKMEARLKELGIRMGDFYAAAEIQGSTWRRWASGEFEPTMRLWRRACDAYEELIAAKSDGHHAPPVPGAARKIVSPECDNVDYTDSTVDSMETHTAGPHSA